MAEITITGTFPHVCHNNAWDADTDRFNRESVEFNRALGARADDDSLPVPDEPAPVSEQPTRELLRVEFSDGERTFNAYVEVDATEDEIASAIRAVLEEARPLAVQAGQSLSV